MRVRIARYKQTGGRAGTNQLLGAHIELGVIAKYGISLMFASASAREFSSSFRQFVPRPDPTPRLYPAYSQPGRRSFLEIA